MIGKLSAMALGAMDRRLATLAFRVGMKSPAALTGSLVA